MAVLGFVTFLQADWADYQPVSFTRALASGTVSAGSSSLVAMPQNYKFRVKAAYSGKPRKIAPKRLELIAQWGETLQQENFTRHFLDEIEVRGEGRTVWLPIQDVLVDDLQKEVNIGAPMDLYIMYIGAVQEDRIFLVNDFETGK